MLCPEKMLLVACMLFTHEFSQFLIISLFSCLAAKLRRLVHVHYLFSQEIIKWDKPLTNYGANIEMVLMLIQNCLLIHYYRSRNFIVLKCVPKRLLIHPGRM
jgi:hypothetical protein